MTHLSNRPHRLRGPSSATYCTLIGDTLYLECSSVNPTDRVFISTPDGNITGIGSVVANRTIVSRDDAGEYSCSFEDDLCGRFGPRIMTGVYRKFIVKGLPIKLYSQTRLIHVFVCSRVNSVWYLYWKKLPHSGTISKEKIFVTVCAVMAGIEHSIKPYTLLVDMTHFTKLNCPAQFSTFEQKLRSLETKLCVALSPGSL